MENRMGVELTDAEAVLVDAYERLAADLRNHADALPPFAKRNALKALAALWQVSNGLDMDPGQLYELGG